MPATIFVDGLSDDINPGDGTVTLREAIAAINDGSDLGDANIAANTTGTFGTDDEINFSAGAFGKISLVNGELTIATAVEIIGPGVSGGAFPIQIDGQNMSRIFNVNAAGATVKIEGLYLTNGSVAGDGGAILSNATLDVQSCIFDNNVASGDGAGIAARVGDLTVSSTAFEECSAGNAGGAIYSEVPTIVNDSSTFTHNTATFGGAIEVATSNGSLLMSNSSISNTGFFIAGDEGGGIRLRDVSMTTKTRIVDVPFDECYVNNLGGALAIIGSGDIELIGTGNLSSPARIGSGGAVQSGSFGGSIYISEFRGNSPTVLISGYEMGAEADGHGNYAEFGGNIAIVDVTTDITVVDCDINYGGYHPGYPWSGKGGNVFITGQTDGSITFARNIIRGGLADAGAGVAITDSIATITFDECFIHHNSAQSGHGGGMLIDSVPAITIKNSTISENGASSGFGGGIHETFLPHGHATITQCTIYGNTAIRGGGFYGDGDDSAWLAITNSTIAGNTAQGGDSTSITTESQGGGIWFDDYDTFELKSTIVATNVALAGITDGGPDIHGGALTAHYSLIGVDDGFTHASPASNYFDNNLLGTVGTPLDPGFVPDLFTGVLLALHGGPTHTIAIDENSPAYNTGRNFLDLRYDQRGEPYWRVIGDAPDIGAYEHQPQGWTPAKVSDIVLNEGIPLPLPVSTPSFDFSNQHSRIVSITIHFDMGVTLPSLAAPESAFLLKRVVSNGQTVDDAVAVHASLDSSGTFVTLTFDQSGTAIDNYSLADGRYSLTILADKISGGNFDGDGNGTPGDDYVLSATPYLDSNNVYQAPAQGTIFRLYGDANGNGLVELSEFSAIRTYFNANYATDPGACYVFDFDWNNAVGLEDFSQFRTRYNANV